MTSCSSLLDGVRVISIGIRRAGGGYGVGITATRDLAIPRLAAPLNHVDVAVRVTEGEGRRQRALDASAEERWVRCRLPCSCSDQAAASMASKIFSNWRSPTSGCGASPVACAPSSAAADCDAFREDLSTCGTQPASPPSPDLQPAPIGRRPARPRRSPPGACRLRCFPSRMPLAGHCRRESKVRKRCDALLEKDADILERLLLLLHGIHQKLLDGRGSLIPILQLALDESKEMQPAIQRHVMRSPGDGVECLACDSWREGRELHGGWLEKKALVFSASAASSAG